MDPYYQEDLSALQEWWQRNGKALICGLAIGVCGVVGWRFWEARQLRLAEEASGIFQELLARTELGEAEQIGLEEMEVVEKLAKQLRAEYPKTAYASFAALLHARFLAEDGDLAEAASRLRWALENGGEPLIRHIARLRLVRVLLAARELEEAEKELQAVRVSYPSPAYYELQGDLWWLKERKDLAAEYYRQALRAAGAAGRSPFLEMKLEELGPAAAGAGGKS
ncbi:MAG: tetratricopeptide repeat protein [Gammaproteobacteria bacterium]|nr:tetratricopeptide repeat protein [Gammaproteobacteria bacterium]MDD9864090.1 tetratricopeptide repeat protein [Gammaproteobacteria bacterium]